MAGYRQMLEVARASTNFALALYRELSTKQNNLVYSPCSITMALALLHAGAAGRTRDEIGEAMGLAGIDADVHGGLSGILQRLPLSGADRLPRENVFASGFPEDLKAELLVLPFELEIASSLWHRQDIDLEPAYCDLVARLYSVRPVGLDFEGAQEQSCQIMNKWAHDNTRGLIPRILSPSDIDPLAWFYLTSAVYFKSPWHVTFEVDDTRPHDFRCLGGGTARVDMMHRCDYLAYWESDVLQAARLPYASETQSFLIVLPRPGQFGTVQRDLDARFLGQLMNPYGRKIRKVRLALPRFRFCRTLSLKDTLAGLGIRRLFTDDADLSAMSAAPDLWVQDVQHMAHISVDENGTEAGAVTMFTLMTGIPQPEEPVEMIADRPFLFLIVDEPNETILFAGHVANP